MTEQPHERPAATIIAKSESISSPITIESCLSRNSNSVRSTSCSNSQRFGSNIYLDRFPAIESSSHNSIGFSSNIYLDWFPAIQSSSHGSIGFSSSTTLDFRTLDFSPGGCGNGQRRRHGGCSVGAHCLCRHDCHSVQQPRKRGLQSCR